MLNYFITETTEMLSEFIIKRTFKDFVFLKINQPVRRSSLKMTHDVLNVGIYRKLCRRNLV